MNTTLQEYWIFNSSDPGETGLYRRQELVADWRELSRKGYDHIRISGWTQASLRRVASEFKSR